MNEQTLLLVQSFPGTALQVLQHLVKRISFVYFKVGSIPHGNVNVLFFFFCETWRVNKTVTLLCLLTGRKESIIQKSIFLWCVQSCWVIHYVLTCVVMGQMSLYCTLPLNLQFSFITLMFLHFTSLFLWIGLGVISGEEKVN